jgi:dihydrolipoamide dehydrogenase
MTKTYDLIVIGSGPGGYVAAIRAAQLGLSTAIVEKEALGGVCLNWGCIPTKTLLKTSQVWNYVKNAQKYGIEIKGDVSVNFEQVIKKSRQVASEMSKGINFLMKKNNIAIIAGIGKLTDNQTVTVYYSNNTPTNYKAKHIIIATGSRAKQVPNIPVDENKIINYKKALALNEKPKSITIIGAGAIGVEFADFYNTIGIKVNLIEYLPRILGMEDLEISSYLEKELRKKGITVYTNTKVEKVQVIDNTCYTYINSAKETQTINTDIVLSAIGVEPNTQDIGLEQLGVKMQNKTIQVNEYYCTNVKGLYAIGDITSGPALAHAASAEAIVCVEKIAGLNPRKINYLNIPACTYCQPEVASVGYTEEKAIEAGYKVKVGKFPFTASGKAATSGNKEGFVKVVFDAQYGELLGAHIIGENASELISSLVIAKQLETTAEEILASVHPHPTMSEAIVEAVANAYGQCINL